MNRRGFLGALLGAGAAAAGLARGGLERLPRLHRKRFKGTPGIPVSAPPIQVATRGIVTLPARGRITLGDPVYALEDGSVSASSEGDDAFVGFVIGSPEPGVFEVDLDRCAPSS